MSNLPKMSSISKMSDDELRYLGIEELVRRIRKLDSEKYQLMVDHSNLMKDVNRRMQVHLLEIRGLKEVNQRLQDDNQELRDLCCFLDDDRQKGRKLAREWQRFGRYTSSVMKSEVVSYQDKLQELVESQESLMKENLELKELCIFLDQDRGGRSGGEIGDRDQGDGSSSSSSAAENQKNDDVPPPIPPPPRLDRQGNLMPATAPQSMINEQAFQYIHQLEDKVRQLQCEKNEATQFTKREEGMLANGRPGSVSSRKFFSSPEAKGPGASQHYQESTGAPYQAAERPYSPRLVAESGNMDSSVSSMRPASVAQAMKVLEVQQQLESDHRISEQNEDMDEAEKAIVRAMCNVVWNKLGESAPGVRL